MHDHIVFHENKKRKGISHDGMKKSIQERRELDPADTAYPLSIP